ncbi:MAG: hypothetical protein ABSA93_37025 [Streptosporangiaceae bacterium]|jgi:sugar/nucleoside kinase (ribokinase family)
MGVTAGMGSGPGGIASHAVALSRLGLNISLAAVCGQDGYGDPIDGPSIAE